MLDNARSHLFDAPHMVVFSALAVMTAVLAFNLLGDAWRAWLGPRALADGGGRTYEIIRSFCFDSRPEKGCAPMR